MDGITEEFPAAVRGYHYYRQIWAPLEGDELPCEHEANNAFDIFAIKVMDTNGAIVGHLPLEMSRITKYIMDREAVVTAIITSDRYRRSPLVQGGLEVPCRIRVTLPTSVLNCRLMDRYASLHGDLYAEPIAVIDCGPIHAPVAETVEPTPKKIKQKAVTGVKDIRSFFKKEIMQQNSDGHQQREAKKKLAGQRKKTVINISDDSESEESDLDGTVDVSFSSEEDDLKLPKIPDLNSDDDSDSY